MNSGMPMNAPMIVEIKNQPTIMNTMPRRIARRMPVRFAIMVTNRQHSTMGQRRIGVRRLVGVLVLVN